MGTSFADFSSFSSVFIGFRTALQKWTKLNELSSFLPKANRPHRIQIENYTANLFISRRRQIFLVLKLDFRSNANFAVFFLCTANLCFGNFASKKSPQTFDNCTSKKREEKVWQTEREMFSSAIKKSSFIQPRATFRLITKQNKKQSRRQFHGREQSGTKRPRSK